MRSTKGGRPKKTTDVRRGVRIPATVNMQRPRGRASTLPWRFYRRHGQAAPTRQTPRRCIGTSDPKPPATQPLPPRVGPRCSDPPTTSAHACVQHPTIRVIRGLPTLVFRRSDGALQVGINITERNPHSVERGPKLAASGRMWRKFRRDRLGVCRTQPKLGSAPLVSTSASALTLSLLSVRRCDLGWPHPAVAPMWGGAPGMWPGAWKSRRRWAKV